jgi:isoleucyl-tRNA synthetase
VAPAELLEIDRYALARAAQLQAEILAHYEVYEFHPVVAKLQLFCSEDLGGFYLDVLKDRLYTTRPRAWRAGPDRAVADHAGHAALDGALPQLHRRGGLEAGGPKRLDLPGDLLDLRRPDAALLAKWARIRDPRPVNKEIEPCASRRGRLVAAGQRC